MKRATDHCGRRIIDIACRCGKVCDTFIAWDQHIQAKHPAMRRAIRKSGEWDQYRLEFRETR